MKTHAHLWLYLAHILLEWEIFQKKFVEKIIPYFIFSNFPPPHPRKSRLLWDNVENYCTAGQAHRWQYNGAHALCMLDNQGYRHTLRISNTYFFPTATNVKRKRHKVTLCLLCLCLKKKTYTEHISKYVCKRISTAVWKTNCVCVLLRL
jgi:hypothetical protein